MYRCQDCLGRIFIFSVLNEDADKKDFRIRKTTTLVCYFKGRERQNVCWKTRYFGIENDGN